MLYHQKCYYDEIKLKFKVQNTKKKLNKALDIHHKIFFYYILYILVNINHFKL